MQERNQRSQQPDDDSDDVAASDCYMKSLRWGHLPSGERTGSNVVPQSVSPVSPISCARVEIKGNEGLLIRIAVLRWDRG